LKPEERVGKMGKRRKKFMFDVNFNIVVISQAATEEELLKNVGHIPHIN
jgi:hypothetical protein